MKTIALLIFANSLLFTFPNISHGQSQTRIGPSLGLHLNHHTLGIRTIDDPVAPLFPAHVDIGGSLGVQFQYSIDSIWSFSSEVALNSLRGMSSVSVTNPEGEFYSLEPSGAQLDSLGDQIFLHSANITYQSISFEIAAQWRPVIDSSWSFGVELGPTFHSIVSHNWRQTLTIEHPDESYVRFATLAAEATESNGRTLIFFDGDIIESSCTRIGMKTSLFAEFENRDSGIVFSPKLFYELGITPVQKTSDSDWRIHRFGVELSLLFPL